MPGGTTAAAPAWTQSLTCSPLQTVPAITVMAGTCVAMRSMADRAADVRRVTSTTPTSPSSNARASGTASAASRTVTTGITGEMDRMRSISMGSALEENGGAAVGRADRTAHQGEQLAAGSGVVAGRTAGGGT